MRYLRTISSITCTIALLLVPQTSLAQLSSSNFIIDSYVIGEGANAQATSSNFTVEFGVSNFTLEPTSEDETSNTSEGTRVDRDEVTTTTSTESTLEESGSLESEPAIDVNENPAQPDVPYLPSPTSPYIPVSITLEEFLESEPLVITPQYSDTSAASSDDSSVTYYTVLGNGDEAFVKIPAGSWLRPNDVSTGESYQVFLRVMAHTVPASQFPLPSYEAELIGDVVYTVIAIDSLGSVLPSFNKPIQLVIRTANQIDTGRGVAGYAFDVSAEAWVAEPSFRFDQTDFRVLVNQTSLLGLWQSEQNHRVMSVVEPEGNTDKAQTNINSSPWSSECSRLLGVCWYWYLGGVLVLYLIVRRLR